MGQVRTTLVFDGSCGFCTTASGWIARRWTGPDAPRTVPWQLLDADDVVELGLEGVDLDRSAWWSDGVHVDEGSQAVARALLAAGGGWGLVGRLLLMPPVSWVAPFGYRLVARYRHRLPGGTPACRIDRTPAAP